MEFDRLFRDGIVFFDAEMALLLCAEEVFTFNWDDPSVLLP